MGSEGPQAAALGGGFVGCVMQRVAAGCTAEARRGWYAAVLGVESGWVARSRPRGLAWRKVQ